MSSKMFLINLAIIMTVMAVAAAVEVFLPLFSRDASAKGRTATNLSLTAVLFAFNWIVTTLTAIVALKLKPAGLLATMKIPLALEVLLTIAVLDFMYGWAAHVLLHKIPFLWRVHQVHHSDPFVDVTTTSRTHPIEGLWRFLFMTIPAWTLGLPVTGILIYRLLGSINGVFEHANIRVWGPLDRIGSLIWVTPNVHKIHHSDQQVETDSNYGNILSIYDRAFGTFTSTDRAPHVRYGLKEVDGAEARSLTGLLAHPFAGERLKEAPAEMARESSLTR